ncbi:MAG: GGDEF domain-containing protein [Alkalibacterium sp.]|nr:GGDEF domain-containing protein [Alkalibacterium sp.]
MFPIKTEDSIVFLINGIALPVLVIFGLIPEMILSSVAIVALMLRSNIKMDQHYRYALNLLMINFLSLVSAGCYYLTLRLLDKMDVAYALMAAMTVYMIGQLLFNQIAVYMIERFFYDDDRAALIGGSFTFTLFTNIVVLPLSIILIYLYDMIQLTGIFIGALPFITVTLGTNFYYKSRVNNKYLKKMTRYSQELSARKNRDNIIDAFIDALLQIFPVDSLSYFSIQSEKTMKREKMIVKGQHYENEDEFFHLSEQSILRKAMLYNSIISRKNANEWKIYCLNDLSYVAESVMVIPVKVLEQTQGVILVSHKTQAMYDEMIVSLVEVFHKYFTIALDNAYHYEQLEESVETDFLTSFPNLKGLSKHLVYKRQKSVHELSLIVLDLDHFKKVNDTHGHQAGNEILKQFAELLRGLLKKNFFLARFGGEEFIILMPDLSVEDA